MRPLPRGAAVTKGVPSASRAQVLPARPGSGSASTWRDTVTSSGAARPKNGLSLSKAAMCLGVSHDSAPPSVRPPRLSAVGVRSSSPAASRVPAKRSSTPPDSTKAASLSCAGPGGTLMSASAITDGFSASSASIVSPPASPALADLGVGRERALDVIGRRQQRLGDVGAGAGEDRDAAAARAFVDQPGRAGRRFVGDDEAADLIAQLDRQIELRVGRAAQSRNRRTLRRSTDPARRARARFPRAARRRRRGSDAPAARRRDCRRRRSPIAVVLSSTTDSLWPRAASASARANAVAPPSSTPSAIHTTSVCGLAARKWAIGGSVARRCGA